MTPSEVRHLAKLESTARRVRAFLEPLWLSYTLADEWSCIEPPLSRGTCRVSAEFLAVVMPDLGFEGWSVHGGPEGFITASGEPWPHYWLSDGTDIIDVTADQLGLAPVVVGRPDRTWYVAGRAEPLAHDRGEPAHVARWLGIWRDRRGRSLEGGMTATMMDRFTGVDAAALAVLLRENAGAEIALVGARAGTGHPVALWTGSVVDAGGMSDMTSYFLYRGIAEDDISVLGESELDEFVARVGEASLEAAAVFSAKHPTLSNVLRQAMYARRDERQGSHRHGG